MEKVHYFCNALAVHKMFEEIGERLGGRFVQSRQESMNLGAQEICRGASLRISAAVRASQMFNYTRKIAFEVRVESPRRIKMHSFQ